jgi:hypothetical protein
VSSLKKNILTIGLTSLFVISGCSTNDNDRATTKSNVVDPIGVHSPAKYYDEDYQNPNNHSDDFGFTRVNKTTVNGKNVNNQVASINREQLAKVISNLIVQLPTINDVSVLVTDEEVLVVYDTDSNNRDKTANQVKRTAMSAVPRFFHVYISDNKALRQNIENYAPLQSDNRGIHYSIQKTVKEMLKSPQGNELNDRENDKNEHKQKNFEKKTTNM